MKTTIEKIKDIRLDIEEDGGDTHVEFEGTADVPTEDADSFLDDLADVIRRYSIG